MNEIPGRLAKLRLKYQGGTLFNSQQVVMCDSEFSNAKTNWKKIKTSSIVLINPPKLFLRNIIIKFLVSKRYLAQY